MTKKFRQARQAGARRARRTLIIVLFHFVVDTQVTFLAGLDEYDAIG